MSLYWVEDLRIFIFSLFLLFLIFPLWFSPAALALDSTLHIVAGKLYLLELWPNMLSFKVSYI